MSKIKVIFSDVGGVLLTNGWDRNLRKQIYEKYNLNLQEVESLHETVFDLFERGKISFDSYLDNVIFNQPRNFSKEELKHYIFNAVKPFPEMLSFVKSLKVEYGLKIVALSNEGRELALDRIERFDFKSFIDVFIFSAFVYMRKPDLAIYQLGLDLLQVEPSEVIYIDDRPNLVQIGKKFGFNTIQHLDVNLTKKEVMRLLTQG